LPERSVQWYSFPTINDSDRFLVWSLTQSGDMSKAPLSATPAEPAAESVLPAWPGPAMLLDEAGLAVSCNPIAGRLLDGDPAWWASLQQWLGAGGALRSSTHSVPLNTDSGPAIVEWTVVPLAGGRTLLLGRDATLERQLRQALTESRQRYKDLVEISSDFAWETGPDGRFVFVSPAGALGFTAEQLVGRHPSELALTDVGPDGLPFDTRIPVQQAEIWLRDREGHPACLVASAVPLAGADGHWRGARGSCRDITESRTRRMELAEARLREKYLSFIVQSTRDDVDPAKTLEIAAGVAVNATGAEGARIYKLRDGRYVPACEQGQPEPGLEEAGQDILRALPTDERWHSDQHNGLRLGLARTLFRHDANGAVLIWRRADEPAWSASDMAMVEAVADQVGVALAQATYQDRLRTLSERDGLTGLYNRRTFLEMLEARFGQGDPAGSALLFFDLDNFKAVNDVQGHAAGDDVLRAVGKLLLRMARKSDLAARLGGDEFVLWLADTDEAGALRVADRLLAETAEFLRPLSAAPDRPLGTSIGVAVRPPGSAETAESLVDRGDQGMYLAKRQGKGHRALAPITKQPAGDGETAT
jgi:diguanylate cyclase (GGDEF)-like protein/PAS domain S-box-containing protein